MTSNATTQTETLLTETKDGVARLTLNRRGQFNALPSALVDGVDAFLGRRAPRWKNRR